MKYLIISILTFFFVSCDNVRPDIPPLPCMHDQVQFIKDNRDLLENLELSEDKKLEGMVLKNQYQLDVFFNGKEIENYPNDLYIKKENTSYYTLQFFTDLNWEYEWYDTQLTQNYTEYKLKCPPLFGDEHFHVIRIDFTLENQEVNRTKITLDGREGKIEKEDGYHSLSTLYP